MTTISRSYPTKADAVGAAEALRALGVTERRVRLLVGRPLGDLREEQVGGFAGPVGPDAVVGTYGGRAVLRRQATGGFAGDSDSQRQGSFVDTDRVDIVTFDRAAVHTRITGLRGARRLLARARLGEDAVEQAVSDLHAGHAVVLAEFAEDGTWLDELAERAA